ncbi:malonate--CoA ligase [Yoonia litorea]|uniref:Malonyl-CoA/methylmalonyl-CoA synthetase n=1 Tax=Yoonia litorea TaxID=1123755 RepID=A0A1I6MID3_9RHOB|nr:malonyl-CoA synthase [Yoonia litorea]SFS15381.1 malonyl-CoA/methylmalonyl-CoA synthetase [Yoonia litorea]
MPNLLYDTLIAPHRENTNTFLISDDGENLTYAAFCQRASQIAHVIAEAGLLPGDRLVVQAPKSGQAVALYAAALQAGVVYLPLNTAYTPAEVAYFVEDASPSLIVCDPAREGDMTDLAASVGATVLTLDELGDGSLRRAADDKPATFQTADRGPVDLAGLLYTSGTTGRSKGAMMSHRNLLSNARALTDLWQITDKDRLVHALPIFHTHGLFVALNTALLAGASIRLMARFDLDMVLEELPRSTLMMGVPTFYTRMLADHRLTGEACRNMRLFISGSAPLLAETHDAFTARTGHKILERYGMTETNMITSNPYDGDRIAGTVGHPLPGVDVKITDNGAEVPRGTIGMIEVRGENVFKGYWNMPEKTKEELRSNGFFITGDLGVMDADGRISIVGRQKDLIITGGYNVYPKEIEDVLNRCDGVAESAVFGVPDADFGEAIVAAIVGRADEDTLRSAVADKLAKFKWPRRYVMMDTLPRNTMGKVQKNILRQDYTGV